MYHHIINWLIFNGLCALALWLLAAAKQIPEVRFWPDCLWGLKSKLF